MGKKINEIEIREMRTNNERMYFSYIAAKIEQIGFGSLNIKLTIKNGKVVNIKNITTENTNIGGG